MYVYIYIVKYTHVLIANDVHGDTYQYLGGTYPPTVVNPQ